MPLHAGVPGALPDGGVNRERALRFHLGNHHKTIYLHRSSKDCFPYAGFFIADVRPAECPVEPGDVVPRNEGSRLWRGPGTTSASPKARRTTTTWCPETKDQGFDGGEAPRPAHQMPGRVRRRGAPRRKIKALTGVKHHVPEGKNDEQKKAWCKKPVPAICLPFLYTKSLVRAY